MSLRRKIIGAAARWAGSSAAPQWARQAVCGFHSTGAASAAAGAPGASPRGLLLSSPNVTPLIEASPPGVVVRRGVPRRGWLPSSDEAFCACVFRGTAWFPRRGPAGSRAPDPANHPSPKISAPTADLKILHPCDRQKRLHHYRPRVRCRRRWCGWRGSSSRHRLVRARSQDGVHHQALPHALAHGCRAGWHQRSSRQHDGG